MWSNRGSPRDRSWAYSRTSRRLKGSTTSSLAPSASSPSWTVPGFHGQRTESTLRLHPLSILFHHLFSHPRACLSSIKGKSAPLSLIKGKPTCLHLSVSASLSPYASPSLHPSVSASLRLHISPSSRSDSFDRAHSLRVPVHSLQSFGIGVAREPRGCAARPRKKRKRAAARTRENKDSGTRGLRRAANGGGWTDRSA